MSNASWQPIADLQTAKNRAAMLQRSRQYFVDQEVLEVDTPTLSKFAATDPHIESLSAQSGLEPGLFLHTSPEYKMKRLLAAGFGDIYQICKVFRDGELGRHHLPEFTLVEWYRLNFGLPKIIRDTIGFIAATLDRPELVASAESRSYEEAFRHTAGFSPQSAGVGELADFMGADQKLRKSIGDNRDEWLDLALAEWVVPDFARDKLTVIYHYPASQAALARICPDNPEVADRFEVFFGTLELANGFVELTDAREQRARFERDRFARRRNKTIDHQIDEDLIDALHAGLPPCSGVAVGFDRLLMLHEDQDDIRAVTNFIY